MSIHFSSSLRDVTVWYGTCSVETPYREELSSCRYYPKGKENETVSSLQRHGMSNIFSFSDKIRLFNGNHIAVTKPGAANNTRRASNTTRMPAAKGSDEGREQYYKYVFKLDDVDIRGVMRLFYMTYNKEKIGTIDDILDKYKGEETALLQQLCEKYSISYDEITKMIDDTRAESNRKKNETSDYRRASVMKKASISSPPPPPPAKNKESVQPPSSPKVHEEVSTDNDEAVVYLPEPWKTNDNERTDSSNRKASVSTPVVPMKSQLNARNLDSTSSNENQGNRLDKKDVQIELLKRDLAETRKELQATAKESKQILELFETLKTANSVIEKSPAATAAKRSHSVKFDDSNGVKLVDSDLASSDVEQNKQQIIPPQIQQQLDSMKYELERTRMELQNVMYNSPVTSRNSPTAASVVDPFANIAISTTNISPKYMLSTDASTNRVLQSSVERSPHDKSMHSQSASKQSRDTDSNNSFDDSDWVECFDPKFKRNYYYSLSKRKSVWIRPSNTLEKSYGENIASTVDRRENQHYSEYINVASTRKLNPSPRSNESHSARRTPTPERAVYEKGRYAFPPKGGSRQSSPINSRNPLTSSKQDFNMREQLRSTSKDPVQKHVFNTRSLSPVSSRGNADYSGRNKSPSSSRSHDSPGRGRIFGDDNYVSSAWKSAIDPRTNRRYYYNKQTGVSTWRRPADFFD